jgi:hypothetical protein
MTDNEILKIRELSREAIDVVFSNRTPFKDPDKAKAICERRLSGAKYKDIADEFCLTICRCRDYVENTMRLYRVILRRRKVTEEVKKSNSGNQKRNRIEAVSVLWGRSGFYSRNRNNQVQTMRWCFYSYKPIDKPFGSRASLE